MTLTMLCSKLRQHARQRKTLTSSACCFVYLLFTLVCMLGPGLDFR